MRRVLPDNHPAMHSYEWALGWPNADLDNMGLRCITMRDLDKARVQFVLRPGGMTPTMSALLG